MGIRSILAKPFAAFIAAETKRWSREPEVHQAKVMEHLIDQASQTAFGKDHSFGLIKNYEDFKKFSKKTGADGIVVSYTGFHPHLLGPNFYAGVKADEAGEISEIKEKHSFTSDKMQGWHSCGTYYFKSGRLIKEYFRQMLDAKYQHNNGEYYVSMVYNLLIKDGLKIFNYPLKYFCQWGTPEDLEYYSIWISRAKNNFTPEDFNQARILKYWQNCTSE